MLRQEQEAPETRSVMINSRKKDKPKGGLNTAQRELNSAGATQSIAQEVHQPGGPKHSLGSTEGALLVQGGWGPYSGCDRIYN